MSILGREPNPSRADVHARDRVPLKLQRKKLMSFPTAGDKRHRPSGGCRNNPDDTFAGQSVSTRQTTSERIQRKANALRWGEALWIRKQRPVKAAVVAFHDIENADQTLLPCFMLPSLPQLSTDFIELASMMDPRQPFFALYLPSEKRNAESGACVHQLAQYYASKIDRFQPTGPLAVGGWSAGATIALVVAQILRGLGREVSLLIVIDGAPPSVVIGPSSATEKAKLAYYRLMKLLITLARLERDLVNRVRHRPSQSPGVRESVRSTWRNSEFRFIWERTIAPITSKIATRILRTSINQRHPAEIASNISGLPPCHQAFARALYDAICNHTPKEVYRGDVLVFESTAEPARSSECVAKKMDRDRYKCGSCACRRNSHVHRRAAGWASARA